MDNNKISEILEEKFNSIVISQKRKNSEITYNKVVVKPFSKKGETVYQLSCYEDKKVYHKNLNHENMCSYVIELITIDFAQCVVFSADADYHILSKKDKLAIKTSAATKKVGNMEHNRKKNYLIAEDENADFLVELGIVGKNGRVKNDMYAKFRQINRYLEFISDIVSVFDKDKTIRIVDFGCGKAYLSFALYYYLKKKSDLNVEIIGLDLKKDVVNFCENLARKLGYDGLTFKYGDIGQYNSDDPFDMVISLHACDTATDEAIYKGILWKSKVILAVPCCQHELNPQLKNAENNGILRYGLMRERFATIVTDTYRALLLETVGYKTEIAEFIETEHTPKNVLIKAVHTGKVSKKSTIELENLKKQWCFEQHLEKLLNEKR